MPSDQKQVEPKEEGEASSSCSWQKRGRGEGGGGNMTSLSSSSSSSTSLSSLSSQSLPTTKRAAVDSRKTQRKSHLSNEMVTMKDHSSKRMNQINNITTRTTTKTTCCRWSSSFVLLPMTRQTRGIRCRQQQKIRWPIPLMALLLLAALTCQVHGAPMTSTPVSPTTVPLMTPTTRAKATTEAPMAPAVHQQPPVEVARDANDEPTLLLILTERSHNGQQQSTRPQQNHQISSPTRHLIKRSGISDQRLAEIQMIRALKKQLERASKLTTINNETGGSQQATASASD